MAWMHNYKHTIIANISLCASFAIYAFLKNEYVAMAMPAIGGLTGIIQLGMPESRSRKHVIMRNIIAVISAVIACTLFYEKPADLLPCLAFVTIRMGEAQQSAAFMKSGFILGAILWLIFGIWVELYLMVALESIMITIFLYKFLIYDRAKRHS